MVRTSPNACAPFSVAPLLLRPFRRPRAFALERLCPARPWGPARGRGSIPQSLESPLHLQPSTLVDRLFAGACMGLAIEPLVKPRTSGGRGGGGYLRRYGGGGGGGDEGHGHESRRELGPAGIWVAIVAIFTFFASFAGAYILRRSIATDWKPLELPSILWANTALLLFSSYAVEHARSVLHQGNTRSFARWWSAATSLGIAFLAGQLIAWIELTQAGVYVLSSPSGCFFYLLTTTHALHLLGGEIAVVYVGERATRAGRAQVSSPALLPRQMPALLDSVDSARIYWHFMAVLWVLLFALLLIWR